MITRKFFVWRNLVKVDRKNGMLDKAIGTPQRARDVVWRPTLRWEAGGMLTVPLSHQPGEGRGGHRRKLEAFAKLAILLIPSPLGIGALGLSRGGIRFAARALPGMRLIRMAS